MVPAEFQSENKNAIVTGSHLPSSPRGLFFVGDSYNGVGFRLPAKRRISKILRSARDLPAIVRNRMETIL
jgi:hypothetical protein